MEELRGHQQILSTLKHYTYPPVVIVEAINRCNLSCIMCPQNELTRPVGTMQFGLFKKIVDDVAMHAPHTQFWLAIMGEVLLMKQQAIDYVSYAVGRGLDNVNLNTNLAVADRALLEGLVTTGLSKIIVGLDAASRQTYERIRVNGDYDRVMQSIDDILEVKQELGVDRPELVLQFIEMDENSHEVEAFRSKFRGRKVTLKIRNRLGWGTAVEAPALDLPPEARDFPCPWLNRTMSVHVTGQVAQCDAAWNGAYYHGDLNYQTIAEVWNGRLAEVRERHWNLDFDFEPCRDCNDWQCGLSEVTQADAVE